MSTTPRKTKPTDRAPGTRGPLKGQGGAPKKQPEERRVAINARVDPATKKALDEMTKSASLGVVIDRLVKIAQNKKLTDEAQ